MSQQYLHILAQRIALLEKNIQCVPIESKRINNFQYNHGSHRLVGVNEREQLTTPLLSDFIFGTDEQIYVSDLNNGKLKLSCPQNISETSIPHFAQIKISDPPTDSEHIITKKYLDELLKLHSSHSTSSTMTSLSIINPSGDCLKMGRDHDIYVNFSIDTDGTLIVGNKFGEIDVLSKQITSLSNVDTTSPDTGSVVVYGGVGIIKNLNVGGGITFATHNGIPTSLDFYECGSLPLGWMNIWENMVDGIIIYQRIGINVTITFPYVGRRAIKTGEIINTRETFLPERLRPIYDMRVNVDVIDNDVIVPGKAFIYGDDGRVVIKRAGHDGTYGGLIGIGICGFHTFSVSFLVPPPQV